MPALNHSLQIISRPIEDLQLPDRKARRHSRRKIRMLAAAIAEYRHVTPVAIDGDGLVIAGVARVLACRELGHSEIPTVCLDHLSQVQRTAFMLADNKLAENAIWDRKLLGEILRNLSVLDLDFNLELTGFEMAEIDLLISGIGDLSAEDPADAVIAPEPGRTASSPSDLWFLGDHRVLCGSVLDVAAVQTLMAHEWAAMIFTDPPYNVPIDGHATGLGAIHHRDFAMASGEMSSPAFQLFLARSLRNLAGSCFGGALIYVCMDWRHMSELHAAGREIDAQLQNVCVWVKDNPGMGSLYRSQHEFVFLFKTGKGPHRNNVQLGKFGRNRSNVWTYAGCTSPSGRKTSEGNLLALHPTVKPVALVADAILDCTARGDIVLDGFLGSGTTLIAAERTGRRCYGTEIDPAYVDTIIRRWQKLTDGAATRAGTGRTFDDLAHEAEVADAA
jgi:DNA modification methylase